MEALTSLRVSMLSPCYWPEVRRGTERMVHQLSSGLIGRGHEVTLITSHAGPGSRRVEDGLQVIRVRRPPDGLLRRLAFEDHLTHVPLSYRALRAEHGDVAHAWFTTDALAAGRWRRVTGRPAVLSYMGVPDRKGLAWRRARRAITARALERCDAVVVLSRHAARAFRDSLGADARVIYPPVDLQVFTPGAGRAEVPTILCTAVPDEPRKRVPLLATAFRLVRAQRPEARLVLLRPSDRRLERELAAPGVEFVEPVEDASVLASRYREAWITVLPSLNDSFGIVLAESMACGTCVVGTNADAIPEVIDRPEVGRLFDGGEHELARALLDGLELAGDPATPAACRRRAEDFSADRCTSAYEELYRELLERR